MNQRKITANYIYTAIGKPLKNGILVLENNTIVDIIDRENDVTEIANLEFYGGMLVPAFIDTFVLLAYPNFSEKDFNNWVKNGILELPQSKTNQIQRGINHLEAFGTKSALDIFPAEESGDFKEKSKIIFTNKNLYFNLPTQNKDNKSPLLVNRYTLTEDATILVTDFGRCVIGTGSLTSHIATIGQF